MYSAARVKFRWHPYATDLKALLQNLVMSVTETRTHQLLAIPPPRSLPADQARFCRRRRREDVSIANDEGVTTKDKGFGGKLRWIVRNYISVSWNELINSYADHDDQNSNACCIYSFILGFHIISKWPNTITHAVCPSSQIARLLTKSQVRRSVKSLRFSTYKDSTGELLILQLD